jgi:diadenosine tetraphosphate (Ap4A) HIT family hydrolase
MKTNDFLGKEWDIHCMGCAISDGSMPVPGGFIQKTRYFCVHQDPLIPLPGFLVIASLRHIQSLADMRQDEYEEFAALLKWTHQAIKQVVPIENLTIVQEESSHHFHLWFFPWTQTVVEEYGNPSLARIRGIMSDYRKQPIGEVEWRELETSIEGIKQYFRRNSALTEQTQTSESQEDARSNGPEP